MPICQICHLAHYRTQTPTALQYFVLAMVLHPSVMHTAQQEIDTVVGRDRVPTFDDASHLPYVQAIIKEVLRWRPVIPLCEHLSCMLLFRLHDPSVASSCTPSDVGSELPFPGCERGLLTFSRRTIGMRAISFPKVSHVTPTLHVPRFSRGHSFSRNDRFGKRMVRL